MKKGFFVFLVLGLFLWGAFPPDKAAAAAGKGTDLMSGVRAATCPASTALPDEAARKALERFSAALWIASADNKGNVMVSPASVYLALAMAVNGAEGETKAAMLEALGDRGLTVDRLNRASRGWTASLSKVGPKTQLAIANSIWFDKGFKPSRPFLQRNADFFGATARRLDFGDKGAPGVINGWVKQATRGTIEKIIESIRRDEVLFLVNAVYFKSDWQTPFEKSETRKEIFHAAGGDVETEFLHRTGRMTVMLGNGATGVALPYDDGRFAFFALLPDGKATPREWLAKQDSGRLFGDIAGMMAQKAGFTVELAMPKFESSYEDGLGDELARLGMGIAFDPARADFSGMNERHTKDLFIGEVKHKTFVRVDEKGTEAAAVTSVGMRLTSLPVVDRRVAFDRPFVYGILDRETGLPLFAGIMENPAGK